MIGVVGTARVKVLDGYNISTLNINQDNFKIAILTSNEISGHCEISFFITIPYNPDCKNLSDYNSVVHPNLNQRIKANAFVISTQVSRIEDMGIQSIKHISKL